MNRDILSNIQQVQKGASDSWKNSLENTLQELATDDRPKLSLVVDDDKLVLRTVRKLLEDHGYAVLTAATGQQGINLLKSVVPKLIVLDLMLPDINGDQVFKFIREQESTAHVPVVFMSGTISDEEEVVLNEQDLQGEAYMAKPFSMDKLNRLADKLLPIVAGTEQPEIE
ncbi:MAG: response regulator [Verrucomicrobiota bacterium]